MHEYNKAEQSDEHTYFLANIETYFIHVLEIFLVVIYETLLFAIQFIS